MKRVAGIIALLLISGCGDESNTTAAESENRTTDAYVLPKEIMLQMAAERGVGGEVYIVGSTNLPSGTKIGVNLFPRHGLPEQDWDVFVSGGKFRSEAFTDHGRSLSPGDHKVQVISIFNEVWQSPAILSIVGKGGANLNGPVIKLDDPSLVDSDKELDVTRIIKFPGLGDEAKAIDAVKRATLIVDGEKSSMNLGECVDFFMKAGFQGLRIGNGWSAQQIDRSKYMVSFDFVNGDAGNEKATWEIDMFNKQVRYVNKNAKYFSFVPAN